MGDNQIKIEFIESYIKTEGGNYQWTNNHGELTRCRNCKMYNCLMYRCARFDGEFLPDDFCSHAERN